MPPTNPEGNPIPITPPEANIKPGIKTTEFWVTSSTVLGAMLTAFISAAGTVPKECTSKWVLSAVGILAAGLAAAGYSVARGRAKSR
jgi:hypothetical protein